MSAARVQPASETAELDLAAPVCDRDWQQRALQRLQASRPRLHQVTLDQALAEPHLGRIVRAFAAQLRAEHQRTEAEAERIRRWGIPVRSWRYPAPRQGRRPGGQR